jgi:hypothetical protein
MGVRFVAQYPGRSTSTFFSRDRVLKLEVDPNNWCGRFSEAHTQHRAWAVRKQAIVDVADGAPVGAGCGGFRRYGELLQKGLSGSKHGT